jgi:hypothetical protein
MAGEFGGIDVTLPANGTITQYYCVEMGASGVTVLNAITDTVTGIAQETAVSGGTCVVRVSGTSKAVAGGAITKGAKLGIDTSGRVTATIAAASTGIGVALETATAAGDIIGIVIDRSEEHA